MPKKTARSDYNKFTLCVIISQRGGVQVSNFNFSSQGIIKPEFELNERNQEAVKEINSALRIAWDTNRDKIADASTYSEEEQEYVKELLSLAEKILKVNRWKEGIENEYDDLDEYEILLTKDNVNEREQEYIEVRNQLMTEELNTIQEYYDLMADFMNYQRDKI